MNIGITVFGLGKLGISYCATLIKTGAKIYGYDIDEVRARAIADGTVQIEEPNVSEKIRTAKPGQFNVVYDPQTAIDNSDITIIVVPTPSTNLHKFSSDYVIQSIEVILSSLKGKQGRHTIVIVSTLFPGSSDAEIIPLIHEAMNDASNLQIDYVYSPSFIAQGEIVKGIEFPEFVLIGSHSFESTMLIKTMHQQLVPPETPILVMSPLEVEITKLASNVQDTMRVAFANSLLAVCEELPEANVDNITHALGLRIRKKFMTAASPFGGPCWPRDNLAFSVFMEELNVPSHIPLAIDLANSAHGDYLTRKIVSLADHAQSISILGLAYKAGTSMVDESFSLSLLESLLKLKKKVICWDPMQKGQNLPPELASTVSNNVTSALEADLIILALPLAELKTMDWKHSSKSTVVDIWGVLSEKDRKSIAKYVPLGRKQTH